MFITGILPHSLTYNIRHTPVILWSCCHFLILQKDNFIQYPTNNIQNFAAFFEERASVDF